jgi:transcriptional regulator with XRE-family HTH domain
VRAPGRIVTKNANAMKGNGSDDDFLESSRSRLGLKLRLARQAKGWTLRELAERCECSESLLSKVENGHAMPSLQKLHRLVRLLDTNIAWLFDEAVPDTGPIHRAGERPFITLDDSPGDHAGVRFERIIPYATGHMLQSSIHHIDVGGQSGEAVSHDGEETGFVLKGRIELDIDGITYLLSAGDAFCFASRLAHSYRNVGEEPASILWTCTPPTF